MGQGVQINQPLTLNLDKSKSSLSPDEMFFALNHDVLTVPDRATPLPANYLGCEITMPAGDNYVIGSHYASLTNETYVFVANTNNAHFIYRQNGDGSCEIVNHSECLQTVFGVMPDVLNPQHSFEQWRVFLRIEKVCSNRHGKELIFTNGLGEIGCIDVEASINTDSFTTPFFDTCPVDCETVQLCVPSSCNCITATFLPLADDQKGFTNKLVDVGFKFMFRHIYYDLRASEWSDISSLYFQDSRSCYDSTTGFPRCLELTLPLGNPLVDKIEIAYSTDNGANWLLYDTVEKYESYTTSVFYWYERELNSELTIANDCFFKYTFCNDKQCQAIDPKEVSRVFNPVARKPQGMVQIKDLLAWYNFVAGTCPVDRDEIDKFIVTADCADDGVCETEYVEVKVRAVIQDFYLDSNGIVYRKGGNVNDTDDGNDAAFFGLAYMADLADDYRVRFAGAKRNFTAYIEGTEQFAEMTQWYANAGFVNRRQVGVLAGAPIIYGIDFFYYQEATFRVRKGTKGFIRLMSHESPDNTDGTSTFVRGTLDDIAVYNGEYDMEGSGRFNEYDAEIYFDATAGDVELEKTFVIDSVAKKSNLQNHSAAVFYGYLRFEDGTPIERAELWDANDERFMTTDHNGFFFRSFDDLDDRQPFSVRVETDCGDFGNIRIVTMNGSYGGSNQTDITLLDTQTIYYKDQFYATADIHVVDCNGDNVGGVVIAMSNSKAKTTDANGIAHFEVRNKSERNRDLTAIVMSGAGCFELDCYDECNEPLPSETVSAHGCYDTTPDISFSTFIINTDNSQRVRGLKKGGVYEWAIVLEGKCGKISAAYELKDGHIVIPKLQENGVSNYCSFSWDAGNIVLPDWVDCLKIVRTENLNPFELQWVVDDIDRRDGKIVLTIQSLNDYNADYFFKTNTVYKYLKGDRVEFIKNGDGEVFTVAANGLLNYATLSPFNDSGDTTADYFNQLIIEDDNKLDDLVKGAVIEIQREKECKTEPTYFSICVSLPVVDGAVVEQTGTFETFDTYLVSRTIGGFPQNIFEHHSPSDFWGERMSDIGKAYFTNKYENEKRYGRGIILTYADEFNRFDSTLMKIFDAPEQGDITALTIVDGKVIQAIGEHDNFLAQVSDSLVRIGSDGLARAAQPDQIISDGEPKISGQFGCQYPHIGSIFFGDGYTRFVDVNKSADVIHNYSVAKDVTMMMTEQGLVSRTKSYFKKICAQIQVGNASAGTDYKNHFRFNTGLNAGNGVLYLTIKKLTQGGINNAQSIHANTNETILYHPLRDAYLGFASFTPEMYGRLNIHDTQGCACLMYLNGAPYIMPLVATEWNTFFGTSVDWVIGISMNKDPRIIKRGLSIEVQDATALWFVSKVETEISGWLSEIPPIKAKRDEDKVSLAFLGNKNSRGGLYGDDRPRGYYHTVTLVRDNSDNQKYNTIDADNQKKYSELGLVIFKFTQSFMSGFNQGQP